MTEPNESNGYAGGERDGRWRRGLANGPSRGFRARFQASPPSNGFRGRGLAQPGGFRGRFQGAGYTAFRGRGFAQPGGFRGRFQGAGQSHTFRGRFQGAAPRGGFRARFQSTAQSAFRGSRGALRGRGGHLSEDSRREKAQEAAYLAQARALIRAQREERLSQSETEAGEEFEEGGEMYFVSWPAFWTRLSSGREI